MREGEKDSRTPSLPSRSKHMWADNHILHVVSMSEGFFGEEANHLTNEHHLFLLLRREVWKTGPWTPKRFLLQQRSCRRRGGPGNNARVPWAALKWVYIQIFLASWISDRFKFLKQEDFQMWNMACSFLPLPFRGHFAFKCCTDAWSTPTVRVGWKVHVAVLDVFDVESCFRRLGLTSLYI